MNHSMPHLELIVSGKEKQLSKEARHDFAYLLGVFQLCHGHSNRWEGWVSRMVDDERVRLNIKGAAERLGAEKLRSRGRRFEIHD